VGDRHEIQRICSRGRTAAQRREAPWNHVLVSLSAFPAESPFLRTEVKGLPNLETTVT
jgi:hypothetical protein